MPAWQAFFPLAACHAALLVPLSLAAMYGMLPWPAPLATPAGHARELLFGFALAVIAGYLLGPLATRRLAALVALWLIGRLDTAGGGWLVAASLADALFAAAVAWWVVPRFFAAKKWRNKVLAPLIGLICLVAVASLAARHQSGWPAHSLLEAGVLWLALLMVFMGGRLIAPAVNGYFKRRLNKSGAGVQPRLEAALIVLLGVLPLTLWLPQGRYAAALLALAAGVLVARRLWGFAPWQCRARADLLALMAGYAWLAIGLGLYALSLTGAMPVSTALHAVTVGALGTLSSSVMLRQAVSRAKAHPEDEPAFMPLALLFAAAAALRVSGGQAALWGAALCWSAAWLILAWRLLRWINRPRRSPSKAPRPAPRRP
ncbi:hypothetical protein GCM10022228_15030 [Halomonas cibimaris]|uniref:NnrS family protein n=1 Tax=Halomonas cibimaris TaxID=657012 RepID=A0ABP7LNY3_9GAMM